MQCGICFENFDHSKHKPFALIPCTHTLCIECILKLNDKTCPTCSKPLTGNNPNWSLLDLIPESSYDILKKKLEQSLNDYKHETDRSEIDQFEFIESQILNHTNEIIKSVKESQSNLIFELNSIISNRTNEMLLLDQNISKIREQLKNNDLNEDQLKMTIQMYSKIKPVENKLQFVFNNQSIHLKPDFIGKLVKKFLV